MSKPTTNTITDFLITPQEQEPQQTQSVNDEHLLKIIDETYSKKDIELKTELNQRQVNAITKAQLYGERYNCQIVKDLAQNHMILLVSKDRKGRKEFSEIARSMQAPSMFEEIQPTLKTRLLGKE